jgi:hypothetical protein
VGSAGGQLGAQDLPVALERRAKAPAMRRGCRSPAVVRQVHGGHAARAELALDGVAVGER